MSYIIGTGWWCPVNPNGPAGAVPQHTTDWHRMKALCEVWVKHVQAYTSPAGIVVVDAASKRKPSFGGAQEIKLLRNFYPEDGSNGLFGTERTGGIRQIFMGGMYAMVNGADYFVWIEGDCLVHGKGIIEKAIQHMGDGDFSAAKWNHEYKLETCFMVFRCSSLPRIMARYLLIKAKYPELKFFGVSDYFKLVWMPFGYGRSRPIDFDESHYFAQHLSKKELSEFKRRCEC